MIPLLNVFSQNNTEILVLKKIIFERIKREAFIRYAYLKRLTKVPYLPPFVAIEPTNYCNYRCIMCPQSSERASSIPRGFMSQKMFDKVIDEVKSYVFEVFIQLGGEPLLHPELIDFVRKAKSRGVLVGLSTNASLLTRTAAQGLIKAGLDKMIISFTDKGKEGYEKVWQGGDYRKVEENIREVLALKRERQNPKITLQIIKFFGQDKDLILEKDFLKTWHRLGVDSFSPVWATYWTGNFKDEAKFRYGEAPRDSYYRPCGAIWRALVVYWDGNVAPCCNDLTRQYILGNIETESIREIWNNEKMVRLRESIAQGRYKETKLCRNCMALWGRLPSEKRKWWGIIENRIVRLYRK